jgi:prepilin-type N-terminal cleavage/methylation domain-containing protein
VKRICNRNAGFTLIELLVVVGIVTILAALLFPALVHAKGTAQRTRCLNNLKQINLGLRLYAGDNNDTFPAAANVTGGPINANHWGIFYKELMKNYIGLQDAATPQDKVFACPSDTFYFDLPSLTYEAQSIHDQSITDYSSYGFSGQNGSPMNPPPAILNESIFPGVFGRKLASIKEPDRTLLVSEIPAFFPWSWHDPIKLLPGQYGVSDAKNLVSFVDGHLSYLKIYWNTNFPVITANSYDPPAGYDYKHSAD